MVSVNPKNVHDTLGKHMIVDGFDMVLDLDKSKGAYLYDSRNERKILDFFSFFASMPVGPNHPRLRNDKVMKEFGRIAVNKPVNSDLYTVEMAEFVETFADVTLPPYLHYLFFISGGGLAVENAIKTAMDWKTQKNLAKGGKETAGKVIHLEGAFHGRTGYTLSLTNTYNKDKIKYFAKFDWPRVSAPNIIYPITPERLADLEVREQKSIDEVKAAIEKYGDDICAFIMEPIQGEGGDNHFRKEYVQAVRKLCTENDIFFIVDEIQSGLGMTGKMWAHQHHDIEPDAIAFGKKSQVCGIAVSKKVDEAPENVFHLPSRLNSTWGGNLVDMMRAKIFLEIIRDEKLVENAEVVGAHLLKRIQQVSEKYPALISNPRGEGLMCAFDLPSPEKSAEFRSLVYEGGVMIIGCGEKTIRFRPVLEITKEQIDEGFDVVEAALEKMSS